MSSISQPVIFNRALLAERRNRAARAWIGETAAAFLLARANDDLIDRLSAIKRQFNIVISLGAQDGALGARLRASNLYDLVVDLDHGQDVLERCQGPKLLADEEALPLKAASVDAVLSSLVLQYVNDLPGTLLQIRQALKPDGLLLAAMIGGATLNELRQSFVAAESECDGGASPRVAPFADGRDVAGLMQRAGFALPVVDSDRFKVFYPSALALMADLRSMGATNVMLERRRAPLRRSTLLRACEIYAQQFARSDGKIPATFEIITMTAWAPDASQPQPLRPGSARTRLADALGTREWSAGEKPSGES